MLPARVFGSMDSMYYCFQNGDAVLQNALTDVMNDLIDDVSLGLCFEVHRAAKIGTLFLSDTDHRSHKEHELVHKSGVDVFGQVPTKKQFECICPNCQRHLAASRFAPHLEKCMGMGRNSSRIASKRIANSNSKRDSDESLDDDNDNDWTYPEKKTSVVSVLKPLGRKVKKEKSNSNPQKRAKTTTKLNKNGENGSPETHTSSNYDNMTVEDRKNILTTTCGVISEHTKKMCTRSVRCPQHNDEQRRLVRQFLLGQGPPMESDDIQVDIDSYEDGDSQSLRDTLQWEASSNSSPADSGSTNSSTNSRKRTSKPVSKLPTTKKKKIVKQSTHDPNPAGSSMYDFV